VVECLSAVSTLDAGGAFGPARQHLEAALRGLDELGRLFAKYAIETQVTIQITPEVDAHVQPCERGTRLALLEIAQREGRRAEALREVERLLAIVPDDPVVLVSFAELVLDAIAPPFDSGQQHALPFTLALDGE
jgi:hypothetical protein